jgi:hypothetical protein
MGVVRSRSNEAHVTGDYVQDLRKLVQAIATKPLAEPRDSWIVRDLGHSLGEVEVGDLLKSVLSVLDHRSELEHRERLSVAADPRRPEKDGAGRVSQYGDGNCEHQGNRYQTQGYSQRYPALV